MAEATVEIVAASSKAIDESPAYDLTLNSSGQGRRTTHIQISSFVKDALNAADLAAFLAELGLTGATALTGEAKIWTTSVAPSGWLECNGAAVSRTTYAALFTTIGITWGVGDGSTTFNLPDFRGEFLRGWDHGRGVDTARAFASAQSEMIGPHDHPFTFNDPSNAPTSGATAKVSTIQTSGGTNSVTTAVNTGTENRPRNKAVMFIIKT